MFLRNNFFVANFICCKIMCLYICACEFVGLSVSVFVSIGVIVCEYICLCMWGFVCVCKCFCLSVSVFVFVCFMCVCIFRVIRSFVSLFTNAIRIFFVNSTFRLASHLFCPYVFPYVCACACESMGLYMCNVPICVCTVVYECVHMFVFARMWIFVYLCVYECVYVCLCVRLCTWKFCCVGVYVMRCV